MLDKITKWMDTPVVYNKMGQLNFWLLWFLVMLMLWV